MVPISWTLDACESVNGLQSRKQASHFLTATASRCGLISPDPKPGSTMPVLHNILSIHCFSLFPDFQLIDFVLEQYHAFI